MLSGQVLCFENGPSVKTTSRRRCTSILSFDTMILGHQKSYLANLKRDRFGFMDEWSWFTEVIPRKWKRQKEEVPVAKSLNSH